MGKESEASGKTSERRQFLLALFMKRSFEVPAVSAAQTFDPHKRDFQFERSARLLSHYIERLDFEALEHPQSVLLCERQKTKKMN